MAQFANPVEGIDLSRGSEDETINAVLSALDIQPGTTQRPVLFCRRRRILVAGGERAGKSFTSALFLITRLPFGSLFWLVGPDYEQATAEFDYCTEFAWKLGAIRSKTDVSRPKIGKCTLVLKTGQVIETKTAAEVQKIAGKAPDGIIMCEAAQHSQMSYLKCVARVGEKRGWLILCGTFEGSENWYAELFNEWAFDNLDGGVAFSLPSWTNEIVYPGGRNDPEILNIERALRRVEGLFEERIAATPIPPVGLVFREVRKSIHVSEKARFNPKLPVYLAIDPSDGGAPYAVGAYQFFPCQCERPHTEDRIEQGHCIDEIYETGKNAEEIIRIARQRPWWGKVKGGAIDVEAPDDKKRWLSFGGIHLRADKVQQLPGIRREKSFLWYEQDPITKLVVTPPHLLFNPKCEGILFEYTKYKRKDPADPDMIPADVPSNNQPNHHIKALWYLLVARYGYVRGKKQNGPGKTWKRRK